MLFVLLRISCVQWNVIIWACITPFCVTIQLFIKAWLQQYLNVHNDNQGYQVLWNATLGRRVGRSCQASGNKGLVKPEYSEQNRALQRREQQGFPKMIGKRGIRLEGHAQQEVCRRRGPFLWGSCLMCCWQRVKEVLEMFTGVLWDLTFHPQTLELWAPGS